METKDSSEKTNSEQSLRETVERKRVLLFYLLEGLEHARREGIV